ISVAADPLPPLSIPEMMRVTHLEDARISPDGRHVAMVLANADFKSNAYRCSLWLVNVSTQERFAISEGPAALSPCWSPDGMRLAFLERYGRKVSISI